MKPQGFNDQSLSIYLWNQSLSVESLFSRSTRYLTRSLRTLVSYRVEHSKRNSISTRSHILFSTLTVLLSWVLETNGRFPPQKKLNLHLH